MPLWGRDEPLQETVDGNNASLNCYNELYTVELSCLWTLPPCWPSLTSQPLSSCMAWPVFPALVLRSTNAFCIESCKKAARMSLVIFARRIWLSWKVWVWQFPSISDNHFFFFFPSSKLLCSLCFSVAFIGFPVITVALSYFWYLLRLTYQTSCGMELAQMREKGNRVVRNKIPNPQNSVNLPSLIFQWEWMTRLPTHEFGKKVNFHLWIHD